MALGWASPVEAGAATESDNVVVSRFEVPLRDRAVMEQIGTLFSIEGGGEGYVDVYVPQHSHNVLKELAPDARLAELDVDAWMRDVRESVEGYLSYKDYQDRFAGYEEQYPELAKVMDIDWLKSKKGTQILALRLTKNVQKEHANRPVAIITASTHGDEWSSTAMSMGALHKIIAEYGKDERVTRILNRLDTYWIPVVSPDSFHKSRYVHGVDPNRIYPIPGRDGEPKIESAKSLMRWYDELKPVGVIDYHAVHGSIIWPWGYSTRSISVEDKKKYNDLATAMASKTGYQQGQVSKVLYTAPGNSIDAWYERYGAIAMTIEVEGSGKKPPVSELAKGIENNREHILTFLEYFVPEGGEEEDEGSSEEDSGDNGSSSGEGSEDENSSSTEEDEEPGGDTGTDEDKGESSKEKPKSKEDKGKDQGDEDDDDADEPSADAGDSAEDSASQNKEGSGGGCRVQADVPGAFAALVLLTGLGLQRRRRFGGGQS